MQLDHEFTVPVPVDQAWEVLLDVERLAPCMPGAVLDEIRGDEFDGRVKVKVGPITVTYGGTASFVEKDAENHKLVIKASGKEAKGAGTAVATIIATLKGTGDETHITVCTELSITGKPAQFGRGVMIDVSNKLLGQFTQCLSEKISGAGPEEVAPANTPGHPLNASSNGSVAATKQTARPEPEAIDLLGAAGAPVLKRVAPLAAALVLLLVVLGIRRKRK